jgi:hypothetical protein
MYVRTVLYNAYLLGAHTRKETELKPEKLAIQEKKVHREVDSHIYVHVRLRTC